MAWTVTDRGSLISCYESATGNGKNKVLTIGTDTAAGIFLLDYASVYLVNSATVGTRGLAMAIGDGSNEFFFPPFATNYTSVASANEDFMMARCNFNVQLAGSATGTRTLHPIPDIHVSTADTIKIYDLFDIDDAADVWVLTVRLVRIGHTAL